MQARYNPKLRLGYSYSVLSVLCLVLFLMIFIGCRETGKYTTTSGKHEQADGDAEKEVDHEEADLDIVSEQLEVFDQEPLIENEDSDPDLIDGDDETDNTEEDNDLEESELNEAVDKDDLDLDETSDCENKERELFDNLEGNEAPPAYYITPHKLDFYIYNSNSDPQKKEFRMTNSGLREIYINTIRFTNDSDLGFWLEDLPTFPFHLESHPQLIFNVMFFQEHKKQHRGTLEIILDGCYEPIRIPARAMTHEEYSCRSTPGIIYGSSPISGECRSDFQEEILIVVKAISHAFDDFDLVVHSFQQTGMKRISAVRENAFQIAF